MKAVDSQAQSAATCACPLLCKMLKKYFTLSQHKNQFHTNNEAVVVVVIVLYKVRKMYICLDILSQDRLDILRHIYMHIHTLNPFATSRILSRSIQCCIVGQITPET